MEDAHLALLLDTRWYCGISKASAEDQPPVEQSSSMHVHTEEWPAGVDKHKSEEAAGKDSDRIATRITHKSPPDAMPSEEKSVPQAPNDEVDSGPVPESTYKHDHYDVEVDARGGNPGSA